MSPHCPDEIKYRIVDKVTRHYQDKQRLVRLAHYDSLTGLANRRLFLETLTEILEGADKGKFRIEATGYRNGPAGP